MASNKIDYIIGSQALDDAGFDYDVNTKKVKIKSTAIPLGDYLKKADANTDYLKKTDALTTYLNKTEAQRDYLSKTEATRDYIQKTAAPIIIEDFTEITVNYDPRGAGLVNFYVPAPRGKQGYTIKAWHCYLRDGASNIYYFTIENLFRHFQYNSGRGSSTIEVLNKGKKLLVPELGLTFNNGVFSHFAWRSGVTDGVPQADTFYWGGYYVATKN